MKFEKDQKQVQPKYLAWQKANFVRLGGLILAGQFSYFK